MGDNEVQIGAIRIVGIRRRRAREFQPCHTAGPAQFVNRYLVLVDEGAHPPALGVVTIRAIYEPLSGTRT